MPSIASGRTSAGAMTGLKPFSTAGADREVDQGQLEQRAPAGEEGEAAAADLRAPLDVDGAEPGADVEVVADREVVGRHLTDLLEHDVVLVAAGGHAVQDDVRDGEVRLAQRRLDLGLLGLDGLHLGRQRLGPLEDGRPLLGRRGLHRGADRLLLGAQRVGAGDGRAARLVGGEQRVDARRVLAAGPLRGAHAVRVLAQQPQVDHRVEATGAPSSQDRRARRGRAGRGWRPASRPAAPGAARWPG